MIPFPQAQQLGSLAINAKDEYEKVVAAALNATQEVQKLSESLEANEKEASELQSQLDKIKAFTAKMEVEEVEIKQLQEDKVTSPGESVPCDTKAEGAHEYEKQIQELEQDIQANMQQYVKLFQEKTDMEKQVIQQTHSM